MIRPVADQLREYAKNTEDNSSGTWCVAPAHLLLRAVELLEGETDQQMYDRIYGPTPIDGAGWAEAAFVDAIEPLPFHEPSLALMEMEKRLREMTWASPHNYHLVTA